MLQQLQVHSLSYREGELHGEQCLLSPFWSCTVSMKNNGSTNFQKSLLAVRKMVISTVKNGRLHYFFSPILFLTLLDVSSQWGLLPLVVLCHWICSITTAWSMVNVISFFWWSMTSRAAKSHEIQIQKLCHFPSTMGNTIFLVALDPVCHFLSFQCLSSTLIHQGRLSRKRIIEKEPDLMEKSQRQS